MHIINLTIKSFLSKLKVVPLSEEHYWLSNNIRDTDNDADIFSLDNVNNVKSMENEDFEIIESNDFGSTSKSFVQSLKHLTFLKVTSFLS